ASRSFHRRSGSPRLELKFPDWSMACGRSGHGRTQSGTLVVFCRLTHKALSMCSRIMPKLHIRGTSWAISPAPCPDLRRSDAPLWHLRLVFASSRALRYSKRDLSKPGFFALRRVGRPRESNDELHRVAPVSVAHHIRRAGP